MFGTLFKGKAKDAVNQFSGNKDFLEGLCASAVLVGAADGTFSDGEVDAAIRSIKSNSAISAGFNDHDIEMMIGKMSGRAGNRAGRMALKDEIREVLARDKSGKMGQAIVLGALDVADQGGIDEKEKAVLAEIASICGQNLEKLMAG